MKFKVGDQVVLKNVSEWMLIYGALNGMEGVVEKPSKYNSIGVKFPCVDHCIFCGEYQLVLLNPRLSRKEIRKELKRIADYFNWSGGISFVPSSKTLSEIQSLIKKI